MSQAKVDKYKEAKKNRKKQMKKEKIQSYLRRGVASLLFLPRTRRRMASMRNTSSSIEKGLVM